MLDKNSNFSPLENVLLFYCALDFPFIKIDYKEKLQRNELQISNTAFDKKCNFEVSLRTAEMMVIFGKMKLIMEADRQ